MKNNASSIRDKKSSIKALTIFLTFIFLLSLALVPSEASASSASSASSDLGNTVALSLKLVNQDPDPALAGDTVEVRIGIQNLGGKDAQNITVGVSPLYPFSLLSGDSSSQNVGAISGYLGSDGTDLQIVKFRLRVDKDCSAGAYPLNVNYYDPVSGAIVEKSVDVEISGKNSAEIIRIDKTVLTPGKETAIKFTINNVGSSPLRDLSFSWSNDDDVILPVGSDNTRYIKYLDVGDSSEIEYKVIADSNADAGLYKLNLYLSYTDPTTNADKKISTIAGVYVGGATDFDVAFSESSSGISSFSIANIGSNPAYSVSVVIPEQNSWSVSGSNSVIIGNLNQGDYTVASFSLQRAGSGASEMKQPQMPGKANLTSAMPRPSSNASAGSDAGADGGANALTVQIAYTTTMGERETVEKSVKMSSSSLTSSLNSTAFSGRSARKTSGISKYAWYILAAACVLGGFIFYKIKKRKSLALRQPGESLRSRKNFQ